MLETQIKSEISAREYNPPIVVMKFGGSSVKDAEMITKVAEIVKSKLNQKPEFVTTIIHFIILVVVMTAFQVFTYLTISHLSAKLVWSYSCVIKLLP